MRNLGGFIMLALTSSLHACSIDHSFSPLPDSEQVTVSLKVPKNLIAKPVEVTYRSSVCTHIVRGGSGDTTVKGDYHRLDVNLRSDHGDNIYSVKLPVHGGGACQWRLSNVAFGIKYNDTTRFGGPIVYGAGGGIVVVFDGNRPQRSHGWWEKVQGDLYAVEDYYPVVSERYIGGYRKRIGLLGKKDIYRVFVAPQARSVYFEPVVHEDFILHRTGPRIKKDGNYTTYKYPDGSVVSGVPSWPDFTKMQAIRLKAEGKK